MIQKIDKIKRSEEVKEICPICKKEKSLILVNIDLKSQFPDFKSDLSIFSERLCAICLNNIKEKYLEFTIQEIYLRLMNKKN